MGQMMKIKIIILSLYSIVSVYAFGATPYEKIFEDKKVITQKGLMTLHNVEGKVYIELPLDMLGQQMLLKSNIERVSDPKFGFVGQRASYYHQVTFSRTDSLALVRLMNRDAVQIADDADEGIKTALSSSNIAPVIVSAPIAALSPDGTAIVFDASALFLEGNINIVNINSSGASGMVSYSGTYKKENSLLRDIEAFEDNIAVITDMTFGMKVSLMGFGSTNEYPTTMSVRTTISTLPDNPMKVRRADLRLGTNLTPRVRYSSERQGTETEYLSNRWRIEPSDPEAYRRGEMVEPVKPIVFYIDTLFTPKQIEAIKKGLESWNPAFEEIGFRNVIQARPYPNDDPEFSAGNTIKYNCVKFVINDSRGVPKNILTDPRTGEILSATMSFGKEFLSVLLRERILRTAAADPRVRANRLPDELMCEAITARIIREMGYCLGLNYNNAGSYAYPVDSLRSATFTAVNGLSASATDDLLFNAVAQPGDMEKGVRMVTSAIGPYDYYAIKWLYSPLLDTATPEQERAQLDLWIEEKAEDPRYRFVMQNIHYMLMFDPRSLAGDMGDDIVKATKYQIENLKYVAENCAGWMDRDDTDNTNKDLFADFVLLRLINMISDLNHSIGGIYIDEKYSTDQRPKFTYVPRERQREVYRYMLEIMSDMTWIDNKELCLMSTPNANISEAILTTVFPLPTRRVIAMNMSSYYTENPYTIEDMLGDQMDFVLRKVKTGDRMTQADKIMLDMMIDDFINVTKKAVISSSSSGSPRSFAAVEIDDSSPEQIVSRLLMSHRTPEHTGIVGGVALDVDPFDTGGYMPMRLQDVTTYYDRDMGTFYFSALKNIKHALQRGAANTRDKTLRNHYEYKLLQIDRVLNGENN